MEHRLPGVESILPEHIFREFEQLASSSSTPGGDRYQTAALKSPSLRLPAKEDDLPEQRLQLTSSTGLDAFGDNHICIYCHRWCRGRSALLVHMRVHNGIKPFVCPVPECGQVFNVKSNLKRHCDRKHKPPEGGKVRPRSGDSDRGASGSPPSSRSSLARN
ncbi:hypothetical protein BDZ89DRAFT_1057388 [Hymenopellis radicata]|nr:hypothetical protein BDZ89DRAFT_1057388 [Hymenopellis radicata]